MLHVWIVTLEPPLSLTFLTHLHGPSRHHYLSLDGPPAHLQSRFWEQQEFPFLFLQAAGCLGTAGKENS